MRFDLRSTSQGTQVEFEHSGYRDSPCKEACARGWRFFLGSSLKRYVETGEGMPSVDMHDPELPDSGGRVPR
ncbi:hypothetical protein XPU_4374 [Xanthomonas arboricola pv. pruni str. MAFF 311562]|uniref:Uncharacterized protein n=2 Tax=Xanthomonas arboricola TaxID=56448 RepID=W4S902_9XANT|nr:hypothetical protein XPU_4374 [Xanthomonas arboricola pv. pruni str. MAFF 311562]